MFSGLKVGVLALQGDFERHLHQLQSLNVRTREVRKTGEVTDLDGLIIPGGESTTMSDLLDRFGMRDELTAFCQKKAVWGTCAGMIMLASDLDDNRVKPLSIIDISVVRNGYGRQVHSFYSEVTADLGNTQAILKASFIRAPMVSRIGDDVNVMSVYQKTPILLSHRKCLVSSFHTELEEDPTLTRFFLENFVKGNTT